MAHTVKVKSVRHVTHNVLRIMLEKPEGLAYIPGQAVDISIHKEGWEKEIRTFTFTSLQDDDYVEFTIKTYPSHNGVTNQLLSLKSGDQITLYDVYGDIHYKGEGIFIAGGAGITPFIAILKKLESEKKIGNNKLIFANRAKEDIIDEEKFRHLLGKNFVNVLSGEEVAGYEHGFITAGLIKNQTDGEGKYYYLCGPPPMMDAVEKELSSLGIDADHIVKEGF